MQSKTALDATQADSLKMALKYLPLPKVDIAMKEALMLVIDILIEEGQAENASQYFKSPTDILRYLWFKNTGLLQIIEPKTIIKRISKNATHFYNPLDTSAHAKVASQIDLKF